jgi:hypothetical protein
MLGLWFLVLWLGDERGRVKATPMRREHSEVKSRLR